MNKNFLISENVPQITSRLTLWRMAEGDYINFLSRNKIPITKKDVLLAILA